MAEPNPQDPTVDELVAFAGELLASTSAGLADPEVLRETVQEARGLWVMLYRINRAGEPAQS